MQMKTEILFKQRILACEGIYAKNVINLVLSDKLIDIPNYRVLLFHRGTDISVLNVREVVGMEVNQQVWFIFFAWF